MRKKSNFFVFFAKIFVAFVNFRKKIFATSVNKFFAKFSRIYENENFRFNSKTASCYAKLERDVQAIKKINFNLKNGKVEYFTIIPLVRSVCKGCANYFPQTGFSSLQRAADTANTCTNCRNSPKMSAQSPGSLADCLTIQGSGLWAFYSYRLVL